MSKARRKTTFVNRQKYGGKPKNQDLKDIDYVPGVLLIQLT